MKDFIEQLEDAAEMRYDEMYVDEDHYKCACGTVISNDEMNFTSPNPYSEPVYNKCLSEYIAKSEKELKSDILKEGEFIDSTYRLIEDSTKSVESNFLKKEEERIAKLVKYREIKR